jgi:hypothetical protein
MPRHSKEAQEMVGRRSTRRQAAAAAVAVAALGTLAFAGWAATGSPASAARLTTASADRPAARSFGNHPITWYAKAGRQSERRLQTLFRTVRIYAAASDRHWVKGKITRRGTAVSVTCWTTGAFYKDVPIWYEVSAPVAGYVSAFNLVAHYSPAVGVPHCLAPVFRERFNALEPQLHIRTAPSTNATIVAYLPRIGSRVIIDCYVTGSPVFQDSIWYHVNSPANGYVSGRFLNTGGDPAPGTPHC